MMNKSEINILVNIWSVGNIYLLFVY